MVCPVTKYFFWSYSLSGDTLAWFLQIHSIPWLPALPLFNISIQMYWWWVRIACFCLWWMTPSSTRCWSTWMPEGAYFRALNGAVVDVCTAQIPEWEAKYVTYSLTQMERTHREHSVLSLCTSGCGPSHQKSLRSCFGYFISLIFFPVLEPFSYPVKYCRC